MAGLCLVVPSRYIESKQNWVPPRQMVAQWNRRSELDGAKLMITDACIHRLPTTIDLMGFTEREPLL